MSNGFTLIEILISLILLSVALLMLDASEISALRQSRAAYFHSVAQNQIKVIFYQIGVANPNVNLIHLQQEWNKKNAEVLPQGFGTLEKNNQNLRISIYWGGAKPEQCRNIQLGQSGCITENIKV